jgi:hypothetical protein
MVRSLPKAATFDVHGLLFEDTLKPVCSSRHIGVCGHNGFTHG